MMECGENRVQGGPGAGRMDGGCPQRGQVSGWLSPAPGDCPPFAGPFLLVGHQEEKGRLGQGHLAESTKHVQ